MLQKYILYIQQSKNQATMYKCVELCSAVNTGEKDSRFIKPHEYDTISCPDECDSLKYTTQVITAQIVSKSLLTTKIWIFVNGAKI